MTQVFFTTEDTEKKEYTEFWMVSVSHARSPRAAAKLRSKLAPPP